MGMTEACRQAICKLGTDGNSIAKSAMPCCPVIISRVRAGLLLIPVNSKQPSPPFINVERSGFLGSYSQSMPRLI